MPETEPKKIYVITNGDYSDYHICAVTTDPVRAEELRRHYTDRWDEAMIEEFINGDPEAGECKNLRPIYHVKAYVEGDGKLYWRAKISCFTNEEYKNSIKVADLRSPLCYGKLIVDAKIDAADEEHAVKIAQDRYYKIRAERLGL